MSEHVPCALNNFEIVLNTSRYEGKYFKKKLSCLKKLTIYLRLGKDICLGILGLEIRCTWREERALGSMEGRNNQNCDDFYTEMLFCFVHKGYGCLVNCSL